MRPTVSLVWAQSTSGVIGRNGAIPWRLPEDMVRFKRLTMGHTVVMGRLTWESLPAKVRPLPGRRNVVLTRDVSYRADGADVAGSLDDALAAAVGPTGSSATASQIWVIGGGQLYASALPVASRCEVTEVAVGVPRDDGDVIAPVLDDTWIADVADWQVSSTGLRYRFSTYRRI
ncbi:dihydrofolate reductase [Mycobacterium sp.]|jgi:dihydrofolate reductase|uniref:dihydrofolate reductase n=1 Tax=Mycobacterium sp. TaxID=1785 RepID=UPI002D2642FB|nr:dihydrofolate reductase [Mycobacterium sp.]HZA10482.1 dihydrofolate reductase [Mycobacterium sp.]